MTTQAEINQFFAMVDMIRQEGLTLPHDLDVQMAKVAKVEKYLLYSKECGTLQP